MLIQEAPVDGLRVEAMFSRSVPPRARSVVRTDPVEQDWVNGKLSLDGSWTPVEFKGFPVAGRPSTYFGFRVVSDRAQTVFLNLSGAGMGYVNGEPRFGDVYGYGTFFFPVALRKGANEIIVTADRTIMLNWRAAPKELSLTADDALLPDWRGKSRSGLGAVVVRNASDRVRTVQVRGEGGLSGPVLLLPFSVAKVPVNLNMSDAEHRVQLLEGGEVRDAIALKSESPKPNESYRVTFRSRIDGSVQYYAVNPARSGVGAPVVLSLHGASVEAIGQARAYGQKDDFNLICPTNRRPYGFNWEDLGRKDALEALAHAQAQGFGRGKPVYLTGHSMGGHGTWHLGVHYPGLWSAIAPCAGWISYDTYGGGANYDLNNPLQKVLHTMNGPSRTLDFVENLASLRGVYIHHGAADDVVPVTEARRMNEAIREIVPTTLFEQPGGGHWFDNDPAPGADSVDWKPIFDLFRAADRPEAKTWTRVVADPMISDRSGPVVIESQIRPRELSRVRLDRTKAGHWMLRTENVSALTIPSGKGLDKLTLDGKVFSNLTQTRFQKVNGQWESRSRFQPAPRDREMGFKGLMDHGYRFVLGTEGTPEENRWAMLAARYLQETSWYRANATPPVVFASQPITQGIYFGSPQSNQALARAVQGQQAWPDGSTTVIAAFPNGRGGVIGGSDLAGMRRATRYPFYVAGAALPDVLWAQGEQVVRAEIYR